MKQLLSALCAIAIVTLPTPVQSKQYAPAQGILFTVTTTDDHNDGVCNGTDCTLREAIQAANSAPTEDGIDFAVTGAINLLSPLPNITGSTEIQGPGPEMLTVQAAVPGSAGRIFTVTATGPVIFFGLKITKGIPGGSQVSGGGIDSLYAPLTVTNCIINDNTNAGISTLLGALTVRNSTISSNSGSGISSQAGPVTVTDSTITGNGSGMECDACAGVTVTNSAISNNSGGGINHGTSAALSVTNSTISYNSGAPFGAGIYSEGSTTITNSTIAANIANSLGGGIMFDGGTLTITNSTITGNSALGQVGSQECLGGGILSISDIPANIKSSLIALNTCSESPDVAGRVNSAGLNLIGKTDGSTGFTHPTDLTGTIALPLDPGLDPNGLQDNGGPTHTIALLPASPAIDKGTADGLTVLLTTDQRGAGFPRTVDNPAIPPATGGDNTDIGAFEFAPPPIAASNALLINESCAPANGAIDPGERVTVNLELMNTNNAATSYLVATLQSSGGVLAPSGPQTYGPIAANSSAARDFSFTVPGNVSSGQTITTTLHLQDGAHNLGTVSFNFTAGPTPCSFVRLVVTSSLSRADASSVAGAITVQNIGSLPANNVTLTTARLGATNGTPLPPGLGNLAPGESAIVVVNFSNSTPGSSSTLTVGGTYSGGTFSSNRRVIVP